MLRAHWDDGRGDDRELEVVVSLAKQQADVRCSRTQRILLRRIRTIVKPVDLLPGGRMTLGTCGTVRVIDVASERTKQDMERMAERCHFTIPSTSRQGMGDTVQRILEQALDLANFHCVSEDALSFEWMAKDKDPNQSTRKEGDGVYCAPSKDVPTTPGTLECALAAGTENSSEGNENVEEVEDRLGAKQYLEDSDHQTARHEDPTKKVWLIEVVGQNANAVGQSMVRDGSLLRAVPFANCECVLRQTSRVPVAITNTTNLYNQTCCIIKPHSIHCAGSILRVLEMHFEVVNLKVATWCTKEADIFLTLYRGCVPSYGENVRQMSSGRFLAVHLAGPRAFERLRALCGPRDPSIAQILDPTSLRASYGIDRVKNAVHCTDLEEECGFELGYVFGGR